jgi:hypothetical protein
METVKYLLGTSHALFEVGGFIVVPCRGDSGARRQPHHSNTEIGAVVQIR